MRRTLLILSVAILSGFLGTRALGQSLARNAQLALVGGTIYTSPTEEPIRNGVILIDGDKIIAVGRRSSVRMPSRDQRHRLHRIDDYGGLLEQPCPLPRRSGPMPQRSLRPSSSRQLQTMITQYGFTSVFDTWSMWENTRRLRDRIEAGEVAGPRIRSTGEATFPMVRVPQRLPQQWHPTEQPGALLGSCLSRDFRLPAWRSPPKPLKPRGSCLMLARTDSNSTP